MRKVPYLKYRRLLSISKEVLRLFLMILTTMAPLWTEGL